MIPQSFEEWYYCITQKCKINLDPHFIKERLGVLTDNNNPETKRIIDLYGINYLQNLINWYKRV